MIVERDGIRCGCGNQGCWEQYSSGRRADSGGARAAQGVAADRGPAARAGGRRPDAITGPFVTQAAEEGDALALELFDRSPAGSGWGSPTSRAARSRPVHPGRRGLAGGHLLLDPVRAAYAAELTGRGHRPLAEVVLAQMGNEAGLVGAADLARREA
jgi:glucokinase